MPITCDYLTTCMAHLSLLRTLDCGLLKYFIITVALQRQMTRFLRSMNTFCTKLLDEFTKSRLIVSGICCRETKTTKSATHFIIMWRLKCARHITEMRKTARCLGKQNIIHDVCVVYRTVTIDLRWWTISSIIVTINMRLENIQHALSRWSGHRKCLL